MLKISLPTKKQLVSDLERTLFLGISVFLAVWIKTPHPLSEAGILGGLTAAGAAIYSLVKSTLSTL